MATMSPVRKVGTIEIDGETFGVRSIVVPVEQPPPVRHLSGEIFDERSMTVEYWDHNSGKIKEIRIRTCLSGDDPR